MGESKRKADRRAALLAQHPLCCFCGGSQPAVTIDHVPARVCFKKKVGPSSYEFPACEECNNGSSLSEIISAFYIRMLDFNEQNFDGDDLSKLISAIANNAPHCLPNPFLPANRKRKLLRERGIKLAHGETLAEQPIAEIPPSVHGHIEVFGRKLLSAMYYREAGLILDSKHSILHRWSQVGSEAAAHSLEMATAWFGELRVGRRENTDIGQQFLYRFGYHPSHRFFGLYVEFGQAISFFVVAGPAEQLAQLDHQEFVQAWRPISEVAEEAKRNTSGAAAP